MGALHGGSTLPTSFVPATTADTSPHPKRWPPPPALLCLGLFAVLVLGQLLTQLPYPQDDLLRNVTAYAWQFDYRQLYPFSPGVPTFDPYIGFDWTLGHVTQWLGASAAVRVAQLVGLGAFLLALLWPVRRSAEPQFWVPVVLFLVAATLVPSRLVAGRPEVLATVWLLSAASLRPRAWLALGMVLSPIYWLMPIYALGALLLQVSWRRRLAMVVLGAAAASCFWLAYAGMDWVHSGLALSDLAAIRPVPAAEAEPAWELLRQPGSWPLFALALVTIWVHRRRLAAPEWLLVIAGFFVVGAAVRHVLVLAPALALWVAAQPWGRAGTGRWCLAVLASLVAGVLTMLQLPGKSGPDLAVPPGAVVLTSYGPAVFYLPHRNVGGVQMAPSIESGWDDPSVVELARKVSAGTLRCEDFEGLPFSHVVAPAKRPPPPECFALVEEAGSWALSRRVLPSGR